MRQAIVRRKHTRVGQRFSVLGAIGATVILSGYFARLFSDNQTWHFLTAAGLLIAAGAFGYAGVMFRRHASLVWQTGDALRCLGCGYEVEMRFEKCPECGASLAPDTVALGTPEIIGPKAWLFLGLMVFALAGAAFFVYRAL